MLPPISPEPNIFHLRHERWGRDRAKKIEFQTAWEFNPLNLMTRVLFVLALAILTNPLVYITPLSSREEVQSMKWKMGVRTYWMKRRR